VSHHRIDLENHEHYALDKHCDHMSVVNQKSEALSCVAHGQSPMQARRSFELTRFWKLRLSEEKAPAQMIV
jgi:hypothetical protein